MSVLFPSKEWAKEFVESVNDDPEFAKNVVLNGGIIIHMQSEEGLLDDDFPLFLQIDQGKIVDHAILSKLDEVDATFILRAKYSVWKKVVLAELAPTVGLVSKRIKVSGSLKELLKNKKGFDVIVDHLKKMDVAFAG
jgi:putative sterol carrier protein